MSSFNGFWGRGQCVPKILKAIKMDFFQKKSMKISVGHHKQRPSSKDHRLHKTWIFQRTHGE